MRGRQSRGVRLVLPWWVALLVLVALGAAAILESQRRAAGQQAEARAQVAEARAATAEALVTAVVANQAATATALAEVGAPSVALKRALDLLLAAYQDPSAAHLEALSDAFSPEALDMVRPEAEHLLSGALHLGGSSGYQLDVVSIDRPDSDQATIQTREEWVYDERDAEDRPVRCVHEQSQQTYTLRRTGPISWLIAAIQLQGSSRSDC